MSTPDITPRDIARIQGTVQTTDGRSVNFTIHGDGTIATRRAAWELVNTLADGLGLPDGFEPHED